MVFFHGGRYEQGSAGVELYDGRSIANLTNTVVVSANYRLGVLGFMTLNEFSGNFGVLDQRLVLQWVQANIAAFNGDPKAVTIFGQSAGGTSVSFHLVSPGSKPYFHKAIVQSSPYSLPILDSKTQQQHYKHFAAETSCKTPDSQCLLGLPWQDVVTAQTAAQAKIYLSRPIAAFYPWTPNVDGIELTADPLTMMQRGEYNHVPLMIGHVLQVDTISFGPFLLYFAHDLRRVLFFSCYLSYPPHLVQ